jgi:hypothetical protein
VGEGVISNHCHDLESSDDPPFKPPLLAVLVYHSSALNLTVEG